MSSTSFMAIVANRAALLIRMSMAPNLSTAVCANERVEASLPVSVRTNEADNPAASSRRAVSRPVRSSISAMTTRAPRAANRCAIAEPMPPPPPVMIATLPSSDMPCLSHIPIYAWRKASFSRSCPGLPLDTTRPLAIR